MQLRADDTLTLRPHFDDLNAIQIRHDVEVDCGVAGRVSGKVIDPSTAADVLVTIRPSDLAPMSDGPIVGKVTSMEYRGEAYYGTIDRDGGQELFFRADHPVALGETVKLGAPADRTLVYAGGRDRV